jgi:hypothetical protein
MELIWKENVIAQIKVQSFHLTRVVFRNRCAATRFQVCPKFL